MLLFLFMTVSSANEIYLENQTIEPVSLGNTLYVGGNGSGNYSSIQDAINDSSDGDTVFVYDDSSPYYENLVVNKSINILGEDRDTIVINGSGNPSLTAVNISADNVTLSGFTIQKYVIWNYTYDNSVINIHSDYNTVSDNIIIGNNISYGVLLAIEYPYPDVNEYYEYNNISNNIITGKFNGIYCSFCNYTTISKNIISTIATGIMLTSTYYSTIIGNKITDCSTGMLLILTDDTYIYGNIITDNDDGIYCFADFNNTIKFNNISYNKNFGLYIMIAVNDEITMNNFIGNRDNAYFCHPILLCITLSAAYKGKSMIPKIHWDGNYWDEPRLNQFIILGDMSLFGYRGRIIGELLKKEGPINRINIDWHPAQEPYDIGG